MKLIKALFWLFLVIVVFLWFETYKLKAQMDFPYTTEGEIKKWGE